MVRARPCLIEASILKHLAVRSPSKSIARELGIAEATVEVHIKSIFRKIGVKNRAQAVMWATVHGSPVCLSETERSPNSPSDASRACPSPSTDAKHNNKGFGSFGLAHASPLFPTSYGRWWGHCFRRPPRPTAVVRARRAALTSMLFVLRSAAFHGRC